MMIYDSLMRLTSGRVHRTAFLLSYLVTLFPPLSVFITTPLGFLTRQEAVLRGSYGFYSFYFFIGMDMSIVYCSSLMFTILFVFESHRSCVSLILTVKMQDGI